ncbi:NUDIX domain-containing protein [Paenibacillus flagellatus]|uniref:Phosphohydrolase n=1 Tax=Paenibacillus flagellatus TaxID=2211139 RepID=A0A2V5K8I1_9BACL|nr:NUDIX domain-containing protein [Paenibacillus flagellatus]PYI55791.1 phosphohydrolase [Paenibacillus flagellatus]
MFYVNARAFIERETNGAVEIVVQTRSKPGEPERLELPGGRLEPFEPILDGLRREVYEETGLTVDRIRGQETRVDTKGMNPAFEVECMRPFCAYQTISGPVDSVGMYFLCTATGELSGSGDDTTNVHWESVEDVRRRMAENPLQFSDVDRAGILFYLKHRFSD